MVFGWKSKKNADGSTSHFKTDRVVRDTSNDSPIVGGFVTEQMLQEQEQELEDFAKQKAQEFEESGEPEITFADMDDDQKDAWKDIENEIKGIEKDKDMTLEDKIALFYSFYTDNKDSMPFELKSRLLSDMESLDKQLKEKEQEDRATAKEERLHNKISKLMQRNQELKLKNRNIPVKPTESLDSQERRKVEQKSDTISDDWEKNLENLLVEAQVY